MKLRLGTRGSPLALAQSGQTAESLKRLHPGLEVETVVIETSGDKYSPSGAPPLGENIKAMFVKELEEALLAGSIDFAVHSCKDLPGELPSGLVLAAFPIREDPRDAFLGGAAVPSWWDLAPGMKVGTTSLRRRIQLKLAKPGVECVVLRGNVDTRLKKLGEGAADAIVLAEAGLRRLGAPHGRESIPVEVMVPAPGQGALALEARSDRPETLRLLAALDHAQTRLETGCERAVLDALGGGCSTPLGACARLADGRLSLAVFWSDAEGRRPVRWSGESAGSVEEARGLALRAAQAVRAGAA